jgi:chorismate mutase/prephenate dehydratase
MHIKDCREEIDRIDAELLRLLNRRALLALEIGELKARAGLPLKDEGGAACSVAHVREEVGELV